MTDQETAEAQRYAKLRREYAELASRKFRSDKRAERFVRALGEFDELTTRWYIRGIGINLEKGEISIGTDVAYLRKYVSDPFREIGNFVVTITIDPVKFTCENVTRQVEDFHHPHVTAEKIMCISNSQQILTAIANGSYHIAFDIIWDALNTTNGTPYSSAAPDKWPLYEEKPDG